MQLFAKYYAISIYVMQIVTPSENTLRNKANFCVISSQRLKTFGFSRQHYIKDIIIFIKESGFWVALFFCHLFKTTYLIGGALVELPTS